MGVSFRNVHPLFPDLHPAVVGIHEENRVARDQIDIDLVHAGNLAMIALTATMVSHSLLRMAIRAVPVFIIRQGLWLPTVEAHQDAFTRFTFIGFKDHERQHV